MRMAGQVLSQLASRTGQYAHHSFGDAGFQQQAPQVQRRQRRDFRRLENATAAGGERRRQLPRGHDQRPVPGHDLRRDPHGFVADQAVEALTRYRGIEGGAGQLGTPAGVVAERLRRVGDFAVQGGRIELAAVERLQFRQRPRVALDQLRNAEQHALLVGWRLPGPAAVQEGRAGPCYRIVGLLR